MLGGVIERMKREKNEVDATIDGSEKVEEEGEEKLNPA